MYGEVEIKFQAFIISTLNGGETSVTCLVQGRIPRYLSERRLSVNGKKPLSFPRIELQPSSP
jgi:hypothetical protein